ncbi:hypothetical protein ANRL4_04025 [Anaerolineae bacterium]|nr:hypothetical protein ANRL4_04025 [Anaerolineae bacterium]
MSKRAKRLQRIRQNPRNVSLRELQAVLEDFGFVLDRSSGSHHSFVGTINGEAVLLTIPLAHPLKAVYVKQALALIDQVVDESDEEVDEEAAHDQE